MPKLELEETTAHALKEAALSNNMTIDEFVRLRLLGKPSGIMSGPTTSPADFDSELDELVFSSLSLPADFSRADIYADHD